MLLVVIANQKVVSIRNSDLLQDENTGRYSKSESGVNPQLKRLSKFQVFCYSKSESGVNPQPAARKLFFILRYSKSESGVNPQQI